VLPDAIDHLESESEHQSPGIRKRTSIG
jgi:hypothetical protein